MKEIKNYTVKVMRNFNDYEGKDINNPNNKFIERKAGDIFDCTKERFEYLLKNNAVESNPLEIRPIEKDVPQETKKKTTRKTTKKKEVK